MRANIFIQNSEEVLLIAVLTWVFERCKQKYDNCHAAEGRKSIDAEKAQEELKSQINALESENDELKNRLSQVISVRVRTNNSGIVNLGDEYRSIKLGEMASEIYDNEWTDAFDDFIRGCITDEQAICILLNLLLDSYEICKVEVQKEWTTVETWHLDKNDAGEEEIIMSLKEGRKRKFPELLPIVLQIALKVLSQDQKYECIWNLVTETGPVRIYIDACVKLCLLMMIHDTPLHWTCPIHPSVDLLGKQRMQAIGHQNAQSTSIVSDVQQHPEDPKPDVAAMDSSESEIVEDTDLLETSNPQSKAVASVEATADISREDENVEAETYINDGDNAEISDYNKAEAFDTDNTHEGQQNNAGIDAYKHSSPEEKVPAKMAGLENNANENVLMNKSVFKEYTKAGKYIEFIVWPALCLSDGNLVRKGVAQCCDY